MLLLDARKEVTDTQDENDDNIYNNNNNFQTGDNFNMRTQFRQYTYDIHSDSDGPPNSSANYGDNIDDGAVECQVILLKASVSRYTMEVATILGSGVTSCVLKNRCRFGNY